MVNINQIREAVKVLSTITEEEWEQIGKMISNQPEFKEEEPEVEKKQISDVEKEKKVTELLRILGIPSHIKGYYYVRKAVLLLINDEEKYFSGVTKVLYPTIAKEFKTTSSKVERAIRHATEIAWERGDLDMQNKIFGYSVSAKTGRPTNSEMISGLTEYVKMYIL